MKPPGLQNTSHTLTRDLYIYILYVTHRHIHRVCIYIYVKNVLCICSYNYSTYYATVSSGGSTQGIAVSGVMGAFKFLVTYTYIIR